MPPVRPVRPVRLTHRKRNKLFANVAPGSLPLCKGMGFIVGLQVGCLQVWA